MFRVCLVFAFTLVCSLAGNVASQTNSEKSSQVPGRLEVQPPDSKDSVAADSAKAAAKAKRKLKAAAKAEAKARKQAAADSAKSAKSTPLAIPDTAHATSASDAANNTSPGAQAPLIPSSSDTAFAKDSATAALVADSAATAKTPAALDDSIQGLGASSADASAGVAVRYPPDPRLFNDSKIIAQEYGFGILGSLVAGALGFYIGSGIETAFEGDAKASKGTLGFTGIRYDNYKGAFWGGATGLVLGSALTTYFVGQTAEEEGDFLFTMAGTAAATAGAFYVAHLMGVNDDIHWQPFIPLLAIPSLGGTLGFNVSRWLNDRKREEIVGKHSSVWLRTPGLVWSKAQGSDRLEIKAIHLTF